MDIELLRCCGTIKQYKCGDFICMEWEQGQTAFLLLEGRVSVERIVSATKTERLSTLEAGAMFGEMSLLEDMPRTASVVVASYRATVLEIEKDHFLALLQFDPDLAYGLLNTLLARLDNTLERLDMDKIGFVLDVRKNKNYLLIQKISEEQFTQILLNNGDHALTLITFLSHMLAKADNMLGTIKS